MIKIQECLKYEKKLYTALLDFIDTNEETDEKFSTVINIIDKYNFVQKNRYKKREILLLLIKVAKDHQRKYNLFEKFEKIIIHLKDKIKAAFSNLEIFQIFKSNKKILLILFKNEIIIPDQSITEMILFFKYHFYFYPEICSFLDERKKESITNKMKKIDENIFDHFEEKRQKGENESYICQIIRNDSVEKFISYLSQKKLSISSSIKPSIFETNRFLIKNEETSLIEYAAFFGSIQIFQYLIQNKIEIKPSLLLYAIHGRNSEIFKIIENEYLKNDDISYHLYLKESIKCHHNELASYINEKYLNQNKTNYLNIYSFQYHDFQFIPWKFEIKNVPYMFEFDFIPIVEISLKAWDIKSINQIIPTLNNF